MAPQGVAFPVQGGCSCGEVRYSLSTAPIIVHCCQWCQRETGASFALHAMIEADRTKLLKGELQWDKLPSASGDGQTIARCSKCKIAIWSVYSACDSEVAEKDPLRLVDVGTLDNPDALPPDAHIWTSSKQPWIVLPESTPSSLEDNYAREEVWSADSLERAQKLHALSEAAQ